MKVIDIWEKKIIEVPDDWIKCSVCGKWYPPESYRKEGQTEQSRTNCFDCYNLSWAEMQIISCNTENYSKNHRVGFIYQLEKQLQDEADLNSAAMPVEELIEKLQQLPKGSKIVITQEGYYAEGEYAYLFNPEPLNNKEGYFVIGHSSQNY